MQGVLDKRSLTTLPCNGDPNNFVWLRSIDYDEGTGAQIADNSTENAANDNPNS